MIDKLKSAVVGKLKPSRVEHVLGVVMTAKKLARLYNYPERDAEVAALLHDYAKYMPYDESLKFIEENGVIIDEFSLQIPSVLHGFISAELGKAEFGIVDEVILDSVRYHTIARRHMTLLDKIVYLADYTEPNRVFTGVENIRMISEENLDEALLIALEETIIYVLERGDMLHPNTVLARNQLLAELAQK